MEKYGVKLSKWPSLKVNYGIKTGLNEAFVIDEVTRNLILENCKDTEERKRTDAVIRPILRGRDIKQNKCEWAHLYLITLVPSKHYKIEDFPAVSKWLEEASWSSEIPYGCGKIKLMQNGKENTVNGKKFKSRKPTNNKWFETQDSINYMDDFYKRKIVFPAIMTGGAFFAIDENKTIVLAPGNYLIVNNLDAVLQYLIDIGYFALRTFYMGGGIEGELKVNRLLLLPVPTANENKLINKLHLSDEELRYITKFNSTLLN